MDFCYMSVSIDVLPAYISFFIVKKVFSVLNIVTMKVRNFGVLVC